MTQAKKEKLAEMNKFSSVVLLIGFIVSPIKVEADVTPTVQPSSQASQVAADTPQSSYVPAATAYQNTDSIPVSILLRKCGKLNSSCDFPEC